MSLKPSPKFLKIFY